MSGAHQPTVLLLGAGNRGRVYTDWMLRHPGRLRLVGVAEPDPVRRDSIRSAHRLSSDACFTSWEDALETAPKADAVIVATQDRMHREPAIRSLELGYHVLLEKPMASTAEDVVAIVQAAGRARGSLTVCHVLRYSSFFRAVRRLVEEGALGSIQSIFLAENVAYYHFAHSYVRGSWRNTSVSSPLILAKSCHDLDILCWLADSPPVSVYSSAGRDFFRSENAPAGAPARCTDGCPVAAQCVYEAEKAYLHGRPLKVALARGSGPLAWAAALSIRLPRLAAALPGLSRYAVWREWPTATITTDLSRSGIQAALRDGPYGRCVFRCDNDQPDHQDSVITFANGVTSTFRLHGRSHEEGRTLRIDGSKATLRGRFGSGTKLELYPHGSLRSMRIPVHSDRLGHAEADAGLMDAWSLMLAKSGVPLTSETVSLASHLVAFAAHQSVVSGQTQRVGSP